MTNHIHTHAHTQHDHHLTPQPHTTREHTSQRTTSSKHNQTIRPGTTQPHNPTQHHHTTEPQPHGTAAQNNLTQHNHNLTPHPHTTQPTQPTFDTGTLQPHIPPTHPNAIPLTAKPFIGDYKGFSWNAQALMAANTQLQCKKGHYLTKLIHSHDFGMVYETHGTKGKGIAYTAPTGCTAFWSHLSAQQAGIGILLHNDFLAQFAKTKDTDWEEIEAGRLARLRLRGPGGDLDLWAVYLATGEDPKADYTARKRTRQLLHNNLAPPSTTLSVVAGDWNYVVHNNDRWGCSQQTWSGNKDRQEADESNEDTFHPHQLHELYQENHTFFSTSATSRIDRVYTNHHISEQLDHKFGCTTLSRPTELSAHAALSYYRQRPPQHNNKDTASHALPTISNATINHPSWARRVAAELHNSTLTIEDIQNPIRRLLLTKKAMHKVSNNMTQDHIFAEATNNDDKLNCTLSFIRAAQNINLSKMYRKYLEYPHIGTFVNPKNPNIGNTQGFRELQNHAVTLAKQHLTDELHEAIQQAKDQPNDHRITSRKNNILTHLKKLTPGNCSTIGALDLGEEGFATDPNQIAQQLANHWKKTFSHKPINKHLLREWLNTLPNLTPQHLAGNTHTSTPNTQHATPQPTKDYNNTRRQRTNGQHDSRHPPTPLPDTQDTQPTTQQQPLQTNQPQFPTPRSQDHTHNDTAQRKRQRRTAHHTTHGAPLPQHDRNPHDRSGPPISRAPPTPELRTFSAIDAVMEPLHPTNHDNHNGTSNNNTKHPTTPQHDRNPHDRSGPPISHAPPTPELRISTAIDAGIEPPHPNINSNTNQDNHNGTSNNNTKHPTTSQRNNSTTTTTHPQNTNQQPPFDRPLGPLGRAHKSRKPLPTQEGTWRVRRKDVETATRHSGNSAPGPDGIPFRAWRALGPLGITILYDVAMCLETDDAQNHLRNAFHDTDPALDHQYNHSLLVCLPKKSTSTTEDGTKAYTPNNTRPLSIVNCDNRLIASAARNRWETHLAEWILPRQQGFLRGRSILTNLLQLDTASMITSLTQPSGACILLDFASAFPSISQEFLFATLEHIGLPHNALNLLNSLYSNSFCEVKQGSTSTPGFTLETGVRQGCPLSPLLYATVAEVLLDAIEHRCPNTLTRCYADDTALVLNNFWKEAPTLQKLFQEFADISGLHLNTAKCVIMPLDEGDLDTFRERLDTTIPSWRNMQVARHGKYLGFEVGPDKGDRSWHDPTHKFLQRCQLWEAQGAGMHYHTTAYNTFALSTLTYIAQLERPPIKTLTAEKEGLKKVITGPHAWIEPEDLWRLKECYGQSSSCKSLHHCTMAAQLRVHRWDPSCQHPHYRLNVQDLQTALNQPRNDVNRLRWDAWYQRSFSLTLEDNAHHYTKHIGPVEELIHKPARNNNDDQHTQPTNPKQHFQRNAYNKLLQAEPYNPTARNRSKFIRWELQDPTKHPAPLNTSCRHNTPAWQARRSLANLQLLTKLTPPRVCAAVLSTLWNRWCTHRRYQRRHWSSNRCLLGCGHTAEDAIEHYFHCTVTQNTLQRQLNLPPQLFANLHSGLLCNANITTTDQLTSIALLTYALYNTINYLRHHPNTPSDQIPDMITQQLREGAKHHPHATTVLDNRWNRQRQSQPLPSIPYTI